VKVILIINLGTLTFFRDLLALNCDTQHIFVVKHQLMELKCYMQENSSIGLYCVCGSPEFLITQPLHSLLLFIYETIFRMSANTFHSGNQLSQPDVRIFCATNHPS